jgi:hyperosmotically inducible periplasmic protein
MKTTLRILAAWIVAVGFAATASASPPDSWITTKVKLALLTGDHVSSNAIHVDTIDGSVTLHGKVRSSEEKQHASRLALRVEGVRGVRDLLQVVPLEEDKPVAMSDSRIEQRLATVLKEEPTLNDSSIKVKSVDKGVVLLAGKADSMGDYLLAVECAHAVPGVRGVFSEIAAPRGKAEWKERPAPHGDSYLTAAVKLRLIGDSQVSVFDVSVDTNHGAVTLFGTVPDDTARAAAEADAKKVIGIMHVENELEVVPGSMRKVVRSNDAAIRTSVEAALKERGIEHLEVSVNNGVVRLGGEVATIWKEVEASITALRVQGVRSLNDDLRVRG